MKQDKGLQVKAKSIIIIVTDAYIKKMERSQKKKGLTLSFKELETGKTRPKFSRRKEIMKISMQIDRREIRKTIEKKSTKLRLVF